MGTQFGVDLVFKAVGGDKISRELKKVSTQAKKVGDAAGGKLKKAFDKASTAATTFGRKAERAFKKATIKAERFKRSLSGVKGLFAGIAAGATGISALKIGIDRGQSEAQLTAIARSYGEIDQALAAAQRTAENFNLSQTEANKEFSALYARLRPLGAEIGAIENAYAGLQTVITTLQLDGNQAAAVFTQVSQALGAGRVELEEFGTVIDNAPTIVAALAKELDVLPNQIKKLVGEGQVSSEQLYRAILRVKEEGVDVLAESFDAPAQGIKRFRNKVEDVVVELTRDSIPVLLGALDSIADALESLIPWAQKAGRAIALAFELALIPVQGFAEFVKAFKEGDWEKLFTFDASGFNKISDAFGKAFAPIEKFERPERGNDEFNIKSSNSDGKSSGSGSGKGRAAKTDDVAALERELKLLQDLAPLKEQLRQADAAGNKIAVSRLNFLIDQTEMLSSQAEALERLNTEEGKRIQQLINTEELNERIREVYAEEAAILKSQAEARENALKSLEDQRELLEAKLNGNEKEVELRQQARDIAKEIVGLDESEVLGILQQNAALEQQVAQFEQMKAAVESLSGAISGELTGAFRSVVDGSKSAEEAMSSALEGIGKAFIDMAMGIIQKQLTMIIYGTLMKALGITMPGAAGGSSPLGMFNAAPEGFNNIGPMTRFGSQGFANGGSPPTNVPSIVGERGPELFIPNQSGRIISNEAMNNYMPGGGGGSGSPVLNMSFQTTSFGGKEFVDREQLEQAMAQTRRQAAFDGAKLGEARTINSLRNNRTSRTRAGI